jgi:DNA end-binding protein Ku
VTEEDFDEIPVSSLKSIEISEFVRLREVNPILFQRSYYLEPEEVAPSPTRFSCRR